MRKRPFVWCLIAVLLPLAGLPAAAEDQPNYLDHVAPLLRNRCEKCHNADRARAGVDVSSYQSLLAGGSGGDLVVPGDPSSSPLFLVVAHEVEPYMPYKQDALPDAEVKTLRLWIQQGLRETAGGPARKARASGAGSALTLSEVPTQAPDGPPPMPEDLSWEPVVVTERPAAVAALATSPWAPLTALAGQRQVLLVHTESRELLGVLPFPEGWPRSLAFSRSGRLLVVGGGTDALSGKVALYDVVEGRRIGTFGDEPDTVLAADLSADQSLLALGGPEKLLKLFATADGTLLHSIKKHTDWITALAFSPDGVLLASADRNGGVQVWEARSGREFTTLTGHTGMITDLAWRADSNVLATASEDGNVRLWDLNTSKAIKAVRACATGVLAVDFLPDGSFVTGGRDGQVKWWDRNGKDLGLIHRFGDLAMAVAVGHDGTRVVAGDWAGNIQVLHPQAEKNKPKVLGALDANPPTLARRLAQARAEREAFLPQLTQVRTARDQAQLATVAPTQELETRKTTRTEHLALRDQQSGLLAQARTQHEAATSALTTAQEDLAAVQQEQQDRRVAKAEAETGLGQAQAAEQQALAITAAREPLGVTLQAAAEAAKAALAEDPEDSFLKTCYEQAQSASNTVQEALQAAQADKAQAVAAQKTHQEIIAQSTARLTELESILPGKQQALEQRTAEEQDLRTALDRTSQEQAAAQAQFEASEVAVADATQALVPLQESLAKAQTALDQQESQLADHERQVALLEAAQINVQRLAARDVVDERQAELADSEAAVNAVRGELAAVQARVQEAEKEQAAMPERLAEQDRLVTEAETAVQAAEQTIQQALQVVQEKQTFRDQLQKALEELHARAKASGTAGMNEAAGGANALMAGLDKDLVEAGALVQQRQADKEGTEQALEAARAQRTQVQALAAAAPGVVEQRNAERDAVQQRVQAAEQAMAEVAARREAATQVYQEQDAAYRSRHPDR